LSAQFPWFCLIRPDYFIEPAEAQQLSLGEEILVSVI
jgi:hypothetical protein